MPFLDGCRLHQIGKVFPPIQNFREDYPEQPKARCESWSWLILGSNPVLTSGELAFCGQESGGLHGLGAEDGPQKDQGISDHFASTGKHATKVYQQASHGIHVAKITESAGCSKFTQVLLL